MGLMDKIDGPSRTETGVGVGLDGDGWGGDVLYIQNADTSLRGDGGGGGGLDTG